MASDGTAVWVSRENRDRLANYGKAGESLNTALDRVLDLAGFDPADILELIHQGECNSVTCPECGGSDIQFGRPVYKTLAGNPNIIIPFWCIENHCAWNLVLAMDKTNVNIWVDPQPNSQRPVWTMAEE